MEHMEKKNKVKVAITIVIIVIITIIISIILVYKNNILNQIYNENETTQKVSVSKLTEEEKNLYNEAIARNDSSLLTGKTVKIIIEEERERKNEEQKNIEKQKAIEEEMKKVEEDSTATLLEEVYRNFDNFMNAIDTATYTYRISDINFEQIRMYYNNTVKAVDTFKTNILQYDELKEKNLDNIAKLDEYVNLFDEATQEQQNIEEFFNSYKELSDKFQVCYEMLFKNVSDGKDIYEYLD